LKTPSVSVVVPTYNSERTLTECLSSIRSQDYPEDEIELIVVDGGSSDSTLDIASRFKARILSNPLRTGEAGKAVGASEARNELIAFIDSDNVLPSADWFLKMVDPFSDADVAASEPLYYTYRRSDSLVSRYCALMGMNDVLCYYLGNYDRYCVLTETWTNMKTRSSVDKGNYLSVEFLEKHIPTVGANGFFVRKTVLDGVGYGLFLFDIDAVYLMVRKGGYAFAKVKIGIIHLFASGARMYAKKTRRRISDYLYYRKLGIRAYPWTELDRRGVQKFILFSLVPPLMIRDVVSGYKRRPDVAWLFHLAAHWITLVTYSLVYTLSFLNIGNSTDARKASHQTRSRP
jgi:glycosyltransferase involved in cell wall biosynthesis